MRPGILNHRFKSGATHHRVLDVPNTHRSIKESGRRAVIVVVATVSAPLDRAQQLHELPRALLVAVLGSSLSVFCNAATVRSSLLFRYIFDLKQEICHSDMTLQQFMQETKRMHRNPTVAFG